MRLLPTTLDDQYQDALARRADGRQDAIVLGAGSLALAGLATWLVTRPSANSNVSFDIDAGVGRLGNFEGGYPAFGFGMGVGGFVASNVALTTRVAGGVPGPGFVVGYAGPSLQYWFNENGWAAGGLGAAFIRDGNNGYVYNIATDLRAGFTHANGVTGSVEIIAASNAQVVSLLLGYHYGQP